MLVQLKGVVAKLSHFACFLAGPTAMVSVGPELPHTPTSSVPLLLKVPAEGTAGMGMLPH